MAQKLLAGIIVFLVTLLHTAILTPLRVVLILMGYIIVPIALPFAKEHEDTRNSHGWVLKTLPNWAWLWSNDVDGLYGDPYGGWAHDDLKTDIGDWSKAHKWYNQLKWAVWRNPVNNLRWTPFYSADIHKLKDKYPSYCGTYDVENRYRRDGSVREGLLVCWMKNGWYFRSGIYFVKQWGSSDRCIRIRIGFKVLPHYSKEEFPNISIGFSTSFQPSKGILSAH